MSGMSDIFYSEDPYYFFLVKFLPALILKAQKKGTNKLSEFIEQTLCLEKTQIKASIFIFQTTHYFFYKNNFHHSGCLTSSDLEKLESLDLSSIQVPQEFFSEKISQEEFEKSEQPQIHPGFASLIKDAALQYYQIIEKLETSLEP